MRGRNRKIPVFVEDHVPRAVVVTFRFNGAMPRSDSPTPPRLFIDRWYGKVLLLLAGTLLLTLSYAPFYQFWAAWIGLVPLMVVVARTKGPVRAAFWGWLAGVMFFASNVWWLLEITGPGVVALVLWLGVYWALACATIRRFLVAPDATAQTPPRPATAVPGAAFLILFPVIWVGAEWIRGNYPFQGFSWFNLSYSQTPALPLCQIADVFGEHGVSFWVALLNGVVTLFILRGWKLRAVVRPLVTCVGIVVAIGLYGLYRIAETDRSLSPGPSVLLVQPNVPQSNTGDKGAPMDELIDFHVSQTHNGLKKAPDTDLVVWSETMMPELNAEYAAGIDALGMKAEYADRFKEDAMRARRLIESISRSYGVAILAGGSYAGRVKLEEVDAVHIRMVKAARRNSAYYFTRDEGALADRYDKIHLVPFGEYIPFERSFPWLYRRLIALGPPNMADYQLDRGDRPVIFRLPKDRRPAATSQPAAQPASWKFVTSICFEDADADLNAWLLRGGGGRGSVDVKQADFIVNVSNDGWFKLTMMPQHLQVATLRSIENRVPTVRSVNTGISGYIDSAGRTRADLLIPPNIEGTLVCRVQLDSRTSFFTIWGNWIGPACAAGLGVVAATGVVARVRRRMAHNAKSRAH